MFPASFGRSVGDFVLQKLIGQGSDAVVYRAFQPSTQRFVALKIIGMQTAVNEDAQLHERFAREAAVIASLEHLHILPIYAYGIENEDVAYIAMRFLSGGTLEQRLAFGPLRPAETASIVMQLASGLEAAHAQQVIHRDLKPSNILFDDVGNAYLSDFGLAKVLTAGAFTRPGTLVGAPLYSAPEVIRAEPIDSRADIYSLGVIVFEMLTGRPPFQMNDEGLISLMQRQMLEVPPLPSSLNPTLPPGIDSVVMRALAKDPTQRYATVQEFALALEATLQHRLPFRIQTLPKRSGLAVLLLLLVITALLLLGVRNSPRGYTLMRGAVGSPDQLVPDNVQVQTARERLGGQGFVAYIACNLESEFQAARARELMDFAAAYSLAYRSYDSANDSALSLRLIETAVSEGAGALILCPLDHPDLPEVLSSLNDGHFPLVLTTLTEFHYGAMLDNDNEQIGSVVGDFAGRLLVDEQEGRGPVILMGYPGFQSSDVRFEAITARVEALAPEADISGITFAFTRSMGYEAMQALLREGVQPTMVITVNDLTALGVIDALVEAGYSPDEVAIISTNAEAVVREYIAEGYFMRGSLSLDRTMGSRIMMDAVVHMLAGGRVPERLMIEPGRMIYREAAP